ncbi:MAG: DEAD/DEAH box helicase family protein [bacterium]
MTRLAFNAGTLEIHDVEDAAVLPEGVRFDERTRCWRAPAQAYADVVMGLVRRKLPWTDEARRYTELASGLAIQRPPRPFQTEALAAWQKNRGRGVVALPTGAGKSWVAMLAIDAIRRSTLVIAAHPRSGAPVVRPPRRAFAQPVGVVGAAATTCSLHGHHLRLRLGADGAPETALVSWCSTSATTCRAGPTPWAPRYAGALPAQPRPPRSRADGRHAELDRLIGPMVYQRDVVERPATYLAGVHHRDAFGAPHRRRATGLRARAGHLPGLRGLPGHPVLAAGAWRQFLQRAARSAEGRRALLARRR